MESIAYRTRQFLEENGWSYRDQEAHTGVRASIVYDITLMRRVPSRWLRQFASVAHTMARNADARVFWEGLLRNLMDEAAPNYITPENAEMLCARPGITTATTGEVRYEDVTLFSDEVAAGAAAPGMTFATAAATTPLGLGNSLGAEQGQDVSAEAWEISRLYMSLQLPESRRAARRMLENLRAAEACATVQQREPVASALPGEGRLPGDTRLHRESILPL